MKPSPHHTIAEDHPGEDLIRIAATNHNSASLTAEAIEAVFNAAPAGTVGLEEEVMLLHPATHQLHPCAPELLERLNPDPRFKLELPASQLEIVTEPARTIQALGAQLIDARNVLADAAAGLALPACAGVHPLSPGCGRLNSGPRYARIAREYASVAARQLVCGLQVHVAPGGADRALKIYNALRSYLPLIAALAANAPFYEGRDTGLASVRPKLCDLLPRQGVPPVLDSWEQFAAALQWGAKAEFLVHPGTWWWELRPHPRYGTLELRVPDAQRTIPQALAIAALIQALIQWLDHRIDGGEDPPSAPSWRIEENRWSACRYGVEGRMADLTTGESRPTRAWLNELLDQLDPVADRQGAADHLATARRMVESNPALEQRAQVARAGLESLPRWLADGFRSARDG